MKTLTAIALVAALATPAFAKKTTAVKARWDHHARAYKLPAISLVARHAPTITAKR